MKVCPSCHEGLPLEAFYRDRKTPTGFASYCKQCKNAHERARQAAKKAEHASRGPLYTNEELAVRASLGLWEHVLEMFTCKELAKIWGCSNDRAWNAKTEPNGIYGKYAFKELQGQMYFGEDMKRKLREYLEV
jgi:hypothetical protein